MANYTAYRPTDIEYIWQDPEGIPFYLMVGYGINYGRFYGTLFAPPPNVVLLWEGFVFSDEASYVDNLPVSYTPTNHTAYKAPGLIDVFYNRILIEPLIMDFGILVSDQIRTITVWNGYLNQSVTLDNILDSGFQGLSIDGDSPPSVFAPLQTRAYDIEATTDGPPNIEGFLNFDWEVGFIDIIVSIIGRRVVLFSYLYKTNMIETLEWMTNVLTADDGKEQRQSIRECPRQRFSIKSFIQTSEYIEADNIMYGWRHQVWAIPVWSEGRHPTTAVSLLDTTIQVDTRFGDFRADGLAVIWENEQDYDLFTILSFTDSQITLDREINNSFGINAIVCPVRTGRMTRHPKRKSTGHNARLDVVFEVDDNTVFSGSASPVVYESEDTYLDVPDKIGAKDFEDNYIRDIRVVDYKTSVVFHYSTWEETKISRSFLVVLEGLEAIWNFRLWLHRRAGKQRPFWMPTFERNMLVTSTGNIGLNFVIREKANRSQASDRNHIYIMMKDGTEYLREVIDLINVADLGEETNVVIGESIAENSEDIDYISYMGLKRLNSDRIQFKWLADNKVECVIPIKEIEP